MRHPSFYPGRSVVFILLLLLSCFCSSAFTQAIRNNTLQQRRNLQRAFTDTSHKYRSIVSRETGINTRILYPYYISSDTTYDLSPYLKQKAGCDFEKAVDTSGCVIVKYSDGFTKKICNGDVTEIITADGRKHVLRSLPFNIKMYVMTLPPPPNPGQGDASYRWLHNYRDSLLADVLRTLGNDNSVISHYTDKESEACGGNIYKQIEYRTIFLEQFLHAK